MAKRPMVRRIGGAIALGTMLAFSTAALAQSESDSAVRAYWTPERLRDAKPMEHHPSKLGPDGLPAAAAPAPTEPAAPILSRRPLAPVPTLPAYSPGAPPVTSAPNVPNPTSSEIAYTTIPLAGKILPPSNDYGYAFTTYRVFPDNSEVKNFPYSAVGHLFFTVTQSGGIDPPGNYQCTASVIRFRIVQTAGHCVGSPNATIGGNFMWYSNWLFIPADMNGTAPFGKWTAFAVGTSGPWSSGYGTVPNSEDWGMLAINDVSKKTIGSKTGYLGYYTLALANNVTTLGYPVSLDNAAYMQYNAGTTSAGSSNTWIVGSAMGPGASGGPWIIDFGQAPTCDGPCIPVSGSPDINALGANYIVAATSYGPSGAVGYLGASQFNSDWISLLSTMCAYKTGSC